MRFLPKRFGIALIAIVFLLANLGAQTSTAPHSATSTRDAYGRDNPQDSVTAFLEACRKQDYALAAQYLDLRFLTARNRPQQGPDLAKKLDALLNSASNFHLSALSRDSGDDSDTTLPVATGDENGAAYTLELERVHLSSSQPAIWIFSPQTVMVAMRLNPSAAAPWFARYLPPFLISVAFLETPLWNWLVLLAAAVVLFSLSRHLDRLLAYILRNLSKRLARIQSSWAWIEAMIGPARLFLSIVVFRIVVEAVHPSALARIYIGEVLEVLVVWSVTWYLLRIVDLSLNRVESSLAARRNFSGRSILRLGRRTASATIVILAILVVLSSWGYNTATLIAGLGVGGIAVALAAQQTIANVFGGVSVIGDSPVAIGDFGKFGDLIGTVEDIGMRSTRVRTLNRTVVSIPNATFAAANLENYSQRDKILFNPTFQIKRSTPDEEVWHLIESFKKVLAEHRSIELVPTPVRLTGLTAASFNLEIFVYVLTPDIDEFYKVQSQLLVAINDAFQAAHLELV
jgi:MscS family membrane protein